MVKKAPELETVILAAGRGRRLEPVTLTHSKAMTPILGVPIIERLIKSFSLTGIKRFIVVRAPHDTQMESALAGLNGYDNMEIVSCIQHEPKGTADALGCAKKLIEKNFVLTSCDNLYPEIHFQRLVHDWTELNPSAILTLGNIRPGDLDKAAGVKLKGKEVVEIKEKPGEGTGPWDAISKFLFVLDRSVLDQLDQVRESRRGEKEMQTAIEQMVEKLKPHKKPLGIFVQRYLHLTSAEDLLKIHEHYLHEHKPFSVHPEARLERDVQILEPVMIEKGVMIGEAASIGPDVYIGHDSRVGRKARLERCVIYPGIHIHDHECRTSEVIISRKD